MFDDSSENKDIDQDLQMQDRTIDKGHDRIEIRNIEVREIEPQEGQVVSEWPEVKTAIRIVARRIRIKTKKESIETRYYISSRKIMNAAILCTGREEPLGGGKLCPLGVGCRIR